MKVLVACEFSGVVRDAFIRAGHDAISVDFMGSDSMLGRHIMGDALDVLEDNDFDLLVAHPPCTYLASSGARWWPNRLEEQADALNFVYKLATSDCPRIAIENPIGRLSAEWRKPDQIIQPWQFGHPEWKTTCLWLKGLPPLVPTAIVEPDKTVGGGKRPGRISSRIHRLGPSKARQRERSRTYTGIAAAMAAQWGTSLQPGIEQQETRLEPGNEFKNFHRLLCERFGYVHDPLDWQRDQLSLIEHIASHSAKEASK
jgi:hypothetical protein